MKLIDFHLFFFLNNFIAGIIGPHIGAIIGTYIFMVSCDCYSEEQERQNRESFRTDASKRANELSTMSIC